MAKTSNTKAVTDEVIVSRIYTIREQKVMLDEDLAELYQVSTGRLNEQGKRNIDRFPADFMFQLMEAEFKILKSQNATSSWVESPKRTIRIRCARYGFEELGCYDYIRIMYKLNKHCSLPKGAWMGAVLLSVLSFDGCRTSKNAGQKDEDGFVRIFDGKTLNNWVGDSTYWRVEDSCLVGVVTPATLLKRNSFIIWQGDMPENFEIRAEFKVSAQGNSGINYRSEKIDGFPYLLRGYQADLDGAKNYTGSNYEERKRTTLASQGEKTIIPPIAMSPDSLQAHIRNNQWVPKIVTGSLGDPAALKSAIKSDDWNDYRIVVQGNHMQHYINGVLMSDVTDNDTVNRRITGFLGVQVHVGPPMRIAYRNFRLKRLK